MDEDGLVEFRNRRREMIAAFERFSPGTSSSHEIHAGSERAALGNPVLQGFARVETAAQFESLPLTELFARWLEGHDPRPDNYRDGRCPVSTRTVVGEVVEGDSTIHVVYRIHTDVGIFGQTDGRELVTARQSGEEWRFVPNRDIGSAGGEMINMVMLDGDEGDEPKQP